MTESPRTSAGPVTGLPRFSEGAAVVAVEDEGLALTVLAERHLPHDHRCADVVALSILEDHGSQIVDVVCREEPLARSHVQRLALQNGIICNESGHRLPPIDADRLSDRHVVHGVARFSTRER